MNKTNLSIYFPHIYKDILEINTLVAAENELFDELETLTFEAEQNQFILTSNSRGLAVYEEMLDIIANPEIEDIQFRRERLISRFSSKPPYTIKYLNKYLMEILGKDGYEIELDKDNYKMTLWLKAWLSNWWNEIEKSLVFIIPVNIEWNIKLKYNQYKSLSLFRHTELGVYTHNQIREESILNG
jgi:hypothetical protein